MNKYCYDRITFMLKNMVKKVNEMMYCRWFEIPELALLSVRQKIR